MPHELDGCFVRELREDEAGSVPDCVPIDVSQCVSDNVDGPQAWKHCCRCIEGYCQSQLARPTRGYSKSP